MAFIWRLPNLFCIFLSKILSANNEENLINGEKIYVEKCILCHGKNGSGWDWGKKVVKPPVPVADLKTILPDRSDDYLKMVDEKSNNAYVEKMNSRLNRRPKDLIIDFPEYLGHS